MRTVLAAVLSLTCSISAAPSYAQPLELTDAQKQRWQIGLIVQATGACSGIVASIPVPMDWPEQKVQVVEQDVSAQVSPVRYRTLSGGVKQMVVTIPQLAAGDTAQALVTFEVTKSNLAVRANDKTAWHAPAKATAELKLYLGVSPFIETNDPEIKRLAAEIVSGKTTDWDKAEAIYDWVREKVQYKFDQELKGAVTALKTGQGDCEELTSLFIAFCRNHKIPARSVWVPDHCYPEFYLEQEGGKGCWIPCQAAGSREFGSIHEQRPVLQKGDSFQMPGERKAKRYAAETFQAKNATANPRVQWVRKQLEAR